MNTIEWLKIFMVLAFCFLVWVAMYIHMLKCEMEFLQKRFISLDTKVDKWLWQLIKISEREVKE